MLNTRGLSLLNPTPPTTTTTTTPPLPATHSTPHSKTQHLLDNNNMQKSQQDTTSNPTTRVLEAAPSSYQPPTITYNDVGVTACAACRHQRKKCTKKCVLAPFFPVEQTQDFQAVQRVFGISNVSKVVRDLSPEDGKKAVDSLIWEASWRVKDPVLGALGEYQRVCQELEFYKTKLNQLTNINHNVCQVPVTQSAVSVLYNNKSAQQCLVGSWINGDNNAINNYNIHSSGFAGCIDNSYSIHNYGSLQSMESVKQERDEQQAFLIHPQDPMMNDFSPFY